MSRSGIPCPEVGISSCPTELQRAETRDSHDPQLHELTDLQRGVALHLQLVHSYGAYDAACVARSWCE